MAHTTYPADRPLDASVTAELRPHRGWLLTLGVIMAVLGLLALVAPVAATFAAELALGAIFVVAGIVEIAQGLQVRDRGTTAAVLLGIVTIAIGALLLLFPLTGVLTLTLALAVLFLVSGVLRLFWALRIRPAQQWGLLAFSGVLALLLGALVISQWPEASAWLLGVLVGIDLIFAGWWMIFLALGLRRAPTSQGRP